MLHARAGAVRQHETRARPVGHMDQSRDLRETLSRDPDALGHVCYVPAVACASCAGSESISMRANSGPLPSSSCLKYTKTSLHPLVRSAMVCAHRVMSCGV